MKISRKQALKKIALGSAGLISLPEIASAMKSRKAESNNSGKPTSNPFQDIDKASQLKDSALIIVDMQNDFVRLGAPLEVPTARDTIATQKALIQAFRKRNLPVVYTKFISHPYYYLLWNWSPQCQPPTKCCWKGHQRFYKDIEASRECTEIIDELLPTPDDIIIEKFGYGAFHETTLEKTLHSSGINSVVIAGTVTQICVEETAREAFHHGFRATIVEDGVSSFASDLHAATLKNFAMKFGWVSKSNIVISNL